MQAYSRVELKKKKDTKDANIAIASKLHPTSDFISGFHPTQKNDKSRGTSQAHKK